jgi:hypothetical protein
MSEPAAEGARRAQELLRLLADGDDAGADRLVDGVPAVRDLVFVGAGLTAVARSEARSLPPAQRAQASTRQLRLGVLRDANRDDPAGLRVWLRRAAEEILLIRSQQAITDVLTAVGQEEAAGRAAAEAAGRAAAEAAGRAAAEATGSAAANTAATST